MSRFANPENVISEFAEVKAGSRIGYFTLAQLQDELSSLLGWPVDLRTPADKSSNHPNPSISSEIRSHRITAETLT